jgi:tetratricopeptide (TPR) repeat protein
VSHAVTKHLVLALALASSLAACRTKGLEGPGGAGSVPEAQRADVPPSLAEIADAIDPGPRPALTVEVPGWIAVALGLPMGGGGDPQAALAEARAAWQAFQEPTTTGGDAAMLEKVVRLARALALAERAGGNVDDASIEALLMLERVYDVLDAPMLANDRNLFARMIQMFAVALAQQGQSSAELDELASLAFGVMKKSGDLHRRTAAAILRRAPGHPDVPDVLDRLVPELVAEREALALGVQRRSLALRGEAATAAHWLDLAGLCSRALEVRCARDALTRAEALAPASETSLEARLTEARNLLALAKQVTELQDAAGLDDGVARGRALLELQRFADARALLEALARRHPEDARPVVGLARLELLQGFDFVAAAEVLERAQPSEHLDREWHELSLGVRATALVYHVLPAIADRGPDEILELLRPTFLQMKRDIDALEALGVEDGRVLAWAYDVAMEALPTIRGDDTTELRALMRGLLPRAAELRARAPGSAHAYTVLLATAELSVDRAAALGVLDVEPPSAHAAALAGRRAQAAFDLVVAWDATERVDGMLALIDRLTEATLPLDVRRLAVDGHVVARRLGRAGEDLAALEQRYRALLSEGAADAVLHNNLAVVVAEQGRTDEALALWAKASELAEEDVRDLPRLNVVSVRAAAALAAKTALAADDRKELEALASDGSPAEVRLQAQAWLVAVARKGERRKAERALLADAVDVGTRDFRPRRMPGRSGVVLRNSVQAGLGYATGTGLQLQLDLRGVPWLVVPCPVTVPQG